MNDTLTQLDKRLDTVDLVLFDHQENELRISKYKFPGYLVRYFINPASPLKVEDGYKSLPEVMAKLLLIYAES